METKQKQSDKPQPSKLPTFTVKTDYGNKLQTSNEVQATSGFASVDKALTIDEKVHGKKIYRSGKAIHTVVANGKEIKPKIETIFS